ncbi:hypothetical protein GQ457_14G009440 [Hibiscus cannabinus]
MAGRIFLLEVEDKLMLKSLQDSNWAYLRKVFHKIQPWEESFKISERVTWVELVGVPLHCWNHQTFMEIAGIWGELLALGENVSQSLGAERMSLLIATNQMEKINMVVSLEVGKECYSIGVSEVNDILPQSRVGKEKHIPAAELDSPPSTFSSSGSSSDEVDLPAWKRVGNPNVIMTAFLDKENPGYGINGKNAYRHLGNEERKGQYSQTTWVDIVKKNLD